MKKLLSLACTLFLILACGGDDAGGGNGGGGGTNELLDVQEKTKTLEASATETSFSIRANCRWKITVSNGWEGLTVSPMEGQNDATVRITTPANSTASMRSATLSVQSAGGRTVNVSISQNAGAPSLKVDKTTLNFDENGGTASFLVTGNVGWQLSYDKTDGWLETSQDADGKVTVTVAKAVASTTREVTIYVISTGATVSNPPSVLVRQTGLPEISFSAEPTQLSFGCVAGAAQTIDIKSNAKWELTLAAVGGGSTDWIAVSPTSGTNDGTITVSCQDNTMQTVRQVIVMIIPGNDINKTTNINIMQEAGTLPEVGSFTAVGDVRYIKDYAEFTMSYQSVFPVTACGLCYSTANQEPTLSDEHTTVTSSQTSALDVSLKTYLLQARQTYYVRAYATSAVGTQYSRQTITLTTIGNAPTQDDNPPLFVRKR